MENVNVLVTLPQQEYNDLEEYCVNNGTTFQKYFVNLHNQFKLKVNQVKEAVEEPQALPTFTNTSAPIKEEPKFKGKKK